MNPTKRYSKRYRSIFALASARLNVSDSNQILENNCASVSPKPFAIISDSRAKYSAFPAPHPPALSKSLHQFPHRGVQPLSDHLKHQNPNLPFPRFQIGQMASVDPEVSSHLDLGPAFALSKRTDSLPQLNAEHVFAGHRIIMCLS